MRAWLPSAFRLRFLLGRLPAFACGGLATLAAAFRQAAGTLQGRVYNPATREYVNNAEVRLEGASQVTYTESDGSFKFTQVAPER